MTLSWTTRLLAYICCSVSLSPVTKFRQCFASWHLYRRYWAQRRGACGVPVGCPCAPNVSFEGLTQLPSGTKPHTSAYGWLVAKEKSRTSWGGGTATAFPSWILQEKTGEAEQAPPLHSPRAISVLRSCNAWTEQGHFLMPRAGMAASLRPRSFWLSQYVSSFPLLAGHCFSLGLWCSPWLGNISRRQESGLPFFRHPAACSLATTCWLSQLPVRLSQRCWWGWCCLLWICKTCKNVQTSLKGLLRQNRRQSEQRFFHIHFLWGTGNGFVSPGMSSKQVSQLCLKSDTDTRQMLLYIFQ